MIDDDDDDDDWDNVTKLCWHSLSLGYGGSEKSLGYDDDDDHDDGGLQLQPSGICYVLSSVLVIVEQLHPLGYVEFGDQDDMVGAIAV